jgi:DNA mismatch endonuclease (patch repair protein)
MRRQARHDTEAERALRQLLFARGLRYVIHRRPIPTLRREADIVFRGARVAVFVDGCFWHGCPEHGTWPKTNAEFWRRKIERNSERDRETVSALESAGWLAIRIWEHTDPLEAAEVVEAAVRERQVGRRPSSDRSKGGAHS